MRPIPPDLEDLAGSREADGGDSANATAALLAPAAVRMVDLDLPLPDLRLTPGRFVEPYRSLLAIARLDGRPLGTIALPVDPTGRVPRERLARGLRGQLEPELQRAFSRRGLPLPRSFPRTGIPSRIFPTTHTSAPCRSISVVIATCSRPASVERCVRSVLDCEYSNAEIIVVENRPSSSATGRMLAARFAHEAGVSYVEEPRRGASRARNAGLAVAEGAIVAFLDDDVVVDLGWLDHCVQAFEAGDDIGCVTGLILPLALESHSQLLLEQFASFGKGFHRRVFRLPDARLRDPLFPYTAGTIGSGANTVVLAEAARRLGGFDTTLGPGTPAVGAEDLDLYVRLLRAGYSVVYEPSVIVGHEHPRGMKRLRRRACLYGVGMGALLGKQLVAGPERSDLLGAVPAGVRYAFDPASRKNASKPAGFPRSLDWLERLGMMIGPLAYVVSVLWAALRHRLNLIIGAEGAAAGSYSTWLVPRGRGPIPVRIFSERASERAANRSPTQRVLLETAAAACLVAPLVLTLGLPGLLRVPAVLALMCLAPGTALLAMLSRRAETALVLGVSLAVVAVLTQGMLWLDAWTPVALLFGLALACLLPLVARLGPGAQSLAPAAPPGPPVPDSKAARAALAKLTSSRVAAWVETLRRASPGRLHVTLLAGALVAWAASLARADLSRMAGLGLLDVMPVTYFFAFALLLAGFAAAAARSDSSPKLLAAYVVGLIVLLHATTPLLYEEPRYAWTYKHLGVIELIAATGGVDREIDVYNNWPAFFAANAWFSSVLDLKPIAYAAWAQVFFNLANVAAVRFALRALTTDERLLWTAACLFVLGNWVGQDYLAPQAFGFLLSLVILGLCLRCGPGPRERVWPRSLGKRTAAARPGLLIGRLAAAVRAERGGEAHNGTAPLSPGAAFAAGAVCFLAVVTSHQLSPVMLISSVALLALVTRRVPLWIPAAMIVVEVWWIALAWPFVESHFNLIDPGSGGAASDARDVGAALSGAAFGFYAPAAVMLVMGLLAVTGGMRVLRTGGRVITPACLILAPVLVAGVQRYGGEGMFRAYLFALPWLGFFAAEACVRAGSSRSPLRLSSGRLAFATSLLGICLLLSLFGQELVNRIAPGEVRAAEWYERNAPSGSTRLHVAASAPARLSSRYPEVTLADPAPLLDRPEFRGHRLGAADLPRVERLLSRRGGRRAYLVMSRQQQNYARLNGLLPAGSIAGLARAVEASRAFRPVYRRDGVWIYERAP